MRKERMVDREEIVYLLRRRGYTHAEIGGLLGISRQRSYQIWKTTKAHFLERDKYVCDLCGKEDKNNKKIGAITLCKECQKRVKKAMRK